MSLKSLLKTRKCKLGKLFVILPGWPEGHWVCDPLLAPYPTSSSLETNTPAPQFVADWRQGAGSWIWVEKAQWAMRESGKCSIIRFGLGSPGPQL